MKISVVMATYNGDRYLSEQLDSILIQTQKPDELVISDDYSTDKTNEILKEFKKAAPFEVRLIQNKGSGFNDNFENALSNCSGDLIFICDQDDIWFDNKIETVYKRFEANPRCQLLIHDLEFCDSNMNKIGQTKIERIESYNDSLQGYVTGMATAVRSKFLKTCLPIPNGLNYDSWIHACANFIEVREILEVVLAYYRRHEKNATKDSLVNTPHKTKYLDFLISKVTTDPKKGIYNDKNLSMHLVDYIERNKKIIITINNDINIELILSKLREGIKIINKRILLQNKRIFKRTSLAFKLYLGGGYSRYSGFKSMLKDIIYI
ncbi:MAG: hypothetical protein CL666_12025 [Balneola sp.]|nr:hypothetical protein [Balneola sp.]|tara:strand:- start:16167 stop:17129 length:963 start_codon:yes stop_codon:yes gene_type:complete